MRHVLLVIPGMSDAELGALQGRTPLEAARTPFLDEFAGSGRLGSLWFPEVGVPSGSVVGIPALLGYDARALALRRGPLEAAGLGIGLHPRDVALRLNFISTFRGTLADTRAGHVSDREARVLLQALRRIETSLDIEIYLGSGYRHLLVIRGGAGLEFATIPPQEVLGRSLRDFYPSGRDAEPLIKFLDAAARLLKEHDVNAVRIDLGENPADAVWLWGEGVDQAVPPFQSLHGLRGAMVAAAPLVRGLAAKAGMSHPEIEGATAEQGTCFASKWQAAARLLADHDLVMIHVAAANEASRAGSAAGKVEALEQIDEHLVGPMLEWVREQPDQRRALVASDHQTSVESLVTPQQGVPIAAIGAGLEGVRSRRFTERTAAKADLQFPHPGALLSFFLQGGTRARGA